MTSTAEHLMRLASEAEDKATDYLSRLANVNEPWDGATSEGQDLMQRAAFHQGQASGFRQSAYFAAILEGTNAND